MSNVYDSVIDDFARSAVGDASTAVGPSPAKAAKALDLSRQSGIPAPLINADPETYQDIIQKQANATLVAGSPPLQRWLNSNPLAASVASDDLHNLDIVAGAAAYVKPRSAFEDEQFRWAHPGGESILGKIGRSFVEGVGTQPLGVSPETDAELRKLGIFGGEMDLFNRVVINTPVAVWDAFTRIFTGATEALGTAGAEASAELGIIPADQTETTAHQIGLFLQLGALVSGAEAPLSPKARIEVETIQAKQRMAVLDGLMASAEASTTRERAPALFREFVEQQVGDHEISFPAEAVSELYRKEGVAPRAGDDILGFEADMAQQLASALSRGGDVTVPLASFVAFAKEDVRKALAQDAKLGGGVSVNEAVDMVPRTDREAIPQTPRRALFLDPLFADAKSAGMTQEEFGAYSKRLGERQAAADEIAKDEAARTPKSFSKAELPPELEEVSGTTDTQIIRPKGIELFEDESGATGTPGLHYKENADTITIQGSFLPSEARGRGFGLQMYRALADKAREKGKTILSDYDVSEDAFRVYEKLKQEGYDVEFAPGLHKGIDEGFPDKYIPGLEDSFSVRIKPTDIVKDQIVAVDSLLSEPMSKLLFDDLRVMRRQNEGEAAPALSFVELEARAKRLFEEENVARASKLKQFVADVERAGRKAELALLKGKVGDAFKAKNEQLLAHLAAREALAFGKELTRASKRVAKFAKHDKIASVEQAYTDQIRNILAQHGIKVARHSPVNFPLSEFVREKTEAGQDLAVASWLFNTMGRDIKELSVREFRELNDSLKSLEHNGRDEMKVIKADAKADKEEIVHAILVNVESLPLRYGAEHGLRNAAREETKKLVYNTDALLVRPEFLIDDLDLRNPLGPLNDSLLRPLMNAKHVEDDLFHQAATRLADLPKIKHRSRLVDNDFINPLTDETFEITRSDLITMALNLGSRRNRELLVQTLRNPTIERRLANVTDPNIAGSLRRQMLGDAEGEVVDFVTRNLTEEDWKFVEGMWDFFKWIKPQVDAVYRRTSGVAPDTIEALSVAGREGGYAPIIHNDVIAPSSVKAELTAFDKNYFRATTANSYTKSRTEAFNPIKIKDVWPTLAHRIREMLHDIAFREAVLNAQKIVYEPRIRAAINKHYGEEYGNKFDSWLKYIANRYNIEDRQLSFISNIARVARRNLIVQTLGFNLKVILTPNLGEALRELAMNPLDVVHFTKNFGYYRDIAFEKSGEIRNTFTNIDRDVNEVLQGSLGNFGAVTSLRNTAARAGMIGAVKIDTALRVLSWWKEYSAMTRKGAAEADAVYSADKIVRKYFGSHSRVDIPAIMRGSEPNKTLWTMFYGFMSSMYNMTRDVVQVSKVGLRRVKRGDYAGARRDFAYALGASFSFIFMTTLFGAVYNPPKEGEDLGDYAGRLFGSNLTSTVPLVRDFANWAFWGFDNRPSPPQQIVQGATEILSDLASKHPEDQKWIKHMINTPGYIFGLPTGQIANDSQFIWNMTTGQERVRSFGEFTHGIVYGRAREKRAPK